MAINTTTIIGDVFLPSGAVREKSYVIFEMTGFDTDAPDGATVVPYPIRAAISAGGSISQALWPNADGVRATFYRVTFEIYNGTSAVLVDGGQVTVPASGGPYVLNDLLPVAPPADADVDDYIAYLAAAVGTSTTAASTASAAASTASAAASSASASASTATTKAAEASASAALIGSAMQGSNNLSEVVNKATALATLGGAAKSANLSDIPNKAAARTNLGLSTVSAPNLVYNPTGTVNQRSYVSGAATSGANKFTLDRWFVLVSGQNLTYTGDDSRRIMTAPAGGVAQVIEGRFILGGTYVMNWTGTATLTVNGTAQANGVAFTLTANTNAKIIFYSGTFTDVKCELGSVPTAFASPDYSLELWRCQRYFWVLPLALDIFGYASGGGGTASSYIYLPNTMRVGPTVSSVMSLGSNFSGSARYASPAVVSVVITGTSAGAFSARYDAGNTFDAELTA